MKNTAEFAKRQGRKAPKSVLQHYCISSLRLSRCKHSDYFIKQLPGHKSDVKDAQWIAECMMKELVRGSFVPPERIQQLRLYDRRIYDLDDEIIRKLAKLDAAVQRCNIRLSNYVSNTDSVSYKSVIDKICEGVTSPRNWLRKCTGVS